MLPHSLCAPTQRSQGNIISRLTWIDLLIAGCRNSPDSFLHLGTALSYAHAMVFPWHQPVSSLLLLQIAPQWGTWYLWHFVFLPVYLWDILCFFHCICRIVSCWMRKQNGECTFCYVLPSLRGKGRSWELVRGLNGIQVWEDGHWTRMRREWWGVGRGWECWKVLNFWIYCGCRVSRMAKGLAVKG